MGTKMKSKSELLAEEYAEEKFHTKQMNADLERTAAVFRNVTSEAFLAGRKSLEDELKNLPKWDEAEVSKFLDAQPSESSIDWLTGIRFGARWQHNECAKYMAARDLVIEEMIKNCISLSLHESRMRELDETRRREFNILLEAGNSKIAEQAQEIERLHEVAKLSEKYWLDKYTVASKDFDEMRNEITRLTVLLHEAKKVAEFYVNPHSKTFPKRSYEFKARAFLSKLEGEKT